LVFFFFFLSLSALPHRASAFYKHLLNKLPRIFPGLYSLISTVCSFPHVLGTFCTLDTVLCTMENQPLLFGCWEFLRFNFFPPTGSGTMLVPLLQDSVPWSFKDLGGQGPLVLMCLPAPCIVSGLERAPHKCWVELQLSWDRIEKHAAHVCGKGDDQNFAGRGVERARRWDSVG